MKRCTILVSAMLLGGFALLAQDDSPPPPPMAAPGAPAVPEAPPPPGPPHRPPMERAFHTGTPGRWWHNPEMAQQLGLSSEQQQKMDDIFQQNRLRLIDLNAALEKAETMLEPLMEADRPDEAKILAQSDRVADARADLEKANTRLLVGIRLVLTPDQWKKLQAGRPAPRPGARDHRSTPGPGPAPGPGEPR